LKADLADRLSRSAKPVLEAIVFFGTTPKL
jgi:hypothetical protein